MRRHDSTIGTWGGLQELSGTIPACIHRLSPEWADFENFCKIGKDWKGLERDGVHWKENKNLFLHIVIANNLCGWQIAVHGIYTLKANERNPHP